MDTKARLEAARESIATKLADARARLAWATPGSLTGERLAEEVRRWELGMKNVNKGLAPYEESNNGQA